MIEAIEKRRLEIGATREALERAAGMASRHYSKLLSGRWPAKASTTARLKLALARLARNPEADGGEARLVDLAYRFAVAWISDREGFDAAKVHAADPAKRATQSEEWMKAAKIRRLAIYAVNQFGGIEQSKLAKAAGMSKAAVSMAIAEIEDARGEPGLSGQLDELSRAITGVWW